MNSTDQFSFSRALHYLKQGGKVARASWDHKECFVFMIPGSTFKVNRAPLNTIFQEGTEVQYKPHLCAYNSDHKFSEWLPSNNDLFAVDWIEVEGINPQ